jgi:hypothetical protein
MPCGHEKADVLGKIQAFAMPNSPQSEIASSQQTPRWREPDSNPEEAAIARGNQVRCFDSAPEESGFELLVPLTAGTP